MCLTTCNLILKELFHLKMDFSSFGMIRFEVEVAEVGA